MSLLPNQAFVMNWGFVPYTNSDGSLAAGLQYEYVQCDPNSKLVPTNNVPQYGAIPFTYGDNIVTLQLKIQASLLHILGLAALDVTFLI